MKVALDARTLQPALRSGVGRSVANLVPLLREHVDLTLLTDARRGATGEHGLPELALRTPVPGVSASWMQWSAPRWLKGFDGIFHCPSYILPARCPVPAVVTIHDISYEHRPEWFTTQQRWSFRLQSRRAAVTARVVLTVSEFVKRDLVTTYGVEPSRVLVAGHGVPEDFRPGAADPELLGRLRVAGTYVVALGGAKRRNLPVAVDAWRRARQQGADARLVVVGKEPYPEEPGLVHAGVVSDPEWAALLAGSSAFLYPTEYEGYGMPAREAIASGTVVVAAPVASLPEVLGDAAAWAETPTATALSRALLEVLADDAGRAARRAASLAQAAGLPGWEHAAAVHLQAYETAAG
ncbi:MAG: glycosyl transferase group 1 [Frankiales bacterium]|nr:glycosyl transferase group 1 [Frankiales bacterium]